MKIYLLHDHEKKNEYADISLMGTWVDVLPWCDACQIPKQECREPYLVEWEPGSIIVGDFTWNSYKIFVLEKVKNHFEEHGFECAFSDNTIFSKSKTKRYGYKIIKHPYMGSTIYYMIPTKKVHLDKEKSGVTVLEECDVCGRKRHTFKMKGIVIPRSEWNGEKIFRIEEFGMSDATFITEEALEMILEQGFTNFHCQEAGVIE